MQKKARLNFNDQSFLINITDDLDYRHRIIEELSGMALERTPMLNPKKGLKDVPFIYWSEEDFNDEEENKIQAIIEEREEEFNDLFEPLVIEGLKVNQNFKLKKREFIWFGDNYNVSKEDKAKGICIDVDIELSCTNKNGRIIHDYER